MTQVKFKQTNEQLKAKFEDLRCIGTGPTIVVAIGDQVGEMIPVKFAQKQSSGNDIAELARSWGGKILTHIENFKPENLKSLKLSEGTIFDGFSISRTRSTTPFYENQSPMEVNGTIITSKGKYAYQQTSLTHGEPKVLGVELDAINVDVEAIRA